MSVFTTVTPDELSAWLLRYSIGSLLHLEGIAAGIENTNYFVTTTQGRYVLTLFEKIKAHELPFYLNLMAHLADRGIPCPRPIASSSNEYLGHLNGKPAALVTCIKGADVKTAGARECSVVGKLLGDLHLAGQGYGPTMPNPRGPQWWHAAARQVAPFLDACATSLLQAELRFQSSCRHAELPRGVIHADLFRDNVLWDGARIGGVIDFYFACTDVLLYDVAITVNDWCLSEGPALDYARVQALVDAYGRVRPFSTEERKAWPAMLRAAALRFWLSRLYDLHLPRPGKLVHAKDPLPFQRLLAYHVSRSDDAQALLVH
jgi:homoserine kinase type II